MYSEFAHTHVNINKMKIAAKFGSFLKDLGVSILNKTGGGWIFFNGQMSFKNCSVLYIPIQGRGWWCRSVIVADSNNLPNPSSDQWNSDYSKTDEGPSLALPFLSISLNQQDIVRGIIHIFRCPKSFATQNQLVFEAPQP